MKYSHLKGFIPILIGIGFFLFTSIYAPPAQSDELRQSLFKETDAALKAAGDKEAAVYAPATFAKGMDSYKKAEDELMKGKAIKEIKEKLAEATAFFVKAAEQANRCTASLGSVVKARSEAALAESEKYMSETWKKAEAKLSAAIKSLEAGEEASAKSKGAEAETLYREGELQSIKVKYLGDARALVKKAEEMGIKKSAPITFEKAHGLLESAEKALDENRHNTAKAKNLADEAQYEVNHAIYLAQAAKRLASEKKTLEEILLEAETPLKTIAQTLGETARFDQGMEPPTQKLLTAIQSLMKQ